MVIAESRPIVIAVVTSRLSTHVELAAIGTVIGMQRNDSVPFAINKLAAGFVAIGRLSAIANPFIKRSITVVAFDCRVVDFHAIACSSIDLICSIPTCPVLQVQAAISFYSIC